MIIDCHSCTMREIACQDCVVTVLLSMTPHTEQAPEITPAGNSALAALADSGLVPPLKYAQ